MAYDAGWAVAGWATDAGPGRSGDPGDRRGLGDRRGPKRPGRSLVTRSSTRLATLPDTMTTTMTTSNRRIADPASATIRPRPILVVDDDPKIVRLVRTYLERDGHDVVSAADGRAAIAAIERHRPALVILDLMLPEIDGRDVIRALRRDEAATGRASIPVLILSARGSLGDRIAGFEDGADDYLPKPFSPAELSLRVGAILRRVAAGSPGDPSPATPGSTGGGPPRPPLRQADVVIDRDHHEVTRAGVQIPLTYVEFRLLETLVEADGRVLSRDQLLDAVYGADATDVLDRTIDVHVGRLRDRLGDDADRPRYVMTVRGVGYRSAPAGPGR